MKPASVLMFALLLASCSLFAQNNTQNSPSFGVAGMEGLGQHGGSATFSVSNATTNECPLGLRAQHLSDGDFVKTGIAHPKGIGQALHLTLSNTPRGPISNATILFRGFTPKGRLSQTAPDAKPNATRRQLVQFKANSDQSATAEIWVAGLSAITSVELVSATFANGSTWATSGAPSCRVTPDLFMPVHP